MTTKSIKLKAAERLIKAQRKLIAHDDQERKSRKEQQAKRSKLLQNVKEHQTEYENGVLQEDFFQEDA